MSLPSLKCSFMILLSIFIFLVALVGIEGVEIETDSHSTSNDAEDSQVPPAIEATSLPRAFQSSCQCPNTADLPSSSNTGAARLLYLITVHNYRTIEDATHLFRALRSPRNIILVHVDAKCDWDVYLNSTLYEEIQACPCGTQVVVESKHSAKWSTWSMNLPTLWGMQLATTQFQGQWDVFFNLSGDTMPVYTTKVVSRLFDPITGPLRGTNFVTSSSCETGFLPSSVYIWPDWWHKRKHYTNYPTGDPNITYVNEHGNEQTIRLVTYFGSQWMALLPSFVKYIVTSLQRKDSLPSRFKDWLIQHNKLMTDETFIPTLLMHVAPFNETLPVVNDDGSLQTLPSMHAIRFERMDENVPTAFGYFPIEQRYEVPNSSIADPPKVWGPYFLGTYDLGNIKDSGALFVRKVSVTIDPNVVRILPVSHVDEIPDIRWPAEVKLSEAPNWEKLRAELVQKAKEKKKKKETEEQLEKDKDTAKDELRS